MKIAILSTMQGYPWAGTEEVWYHFAKLALEEGHGLILGADAQVIGSHQVRELRERGLKTAARKRFRPDRLYQMKQRFLPDMRSIRAFSPDVVLINSGSPLDHFYNRNIWDFVQELPCKKVFFCHFNADRLRMGDRSALAESFRRMDGMVFVSEANRDLLERQLATGLNRAIVIENGPRLTLDKPLPWPEGPPRFAQVARLETEWKGHDILVSMLAGPDWAEADLTVTLYGNGPEKDYIGQLIDFYGQGSRIHFGGFVESMEAVYQDTHALLLPSRGEGMPLAALEAMMCGRPVIATDVGGNCELIEDGRTGFIAEAPTPASFGKALKRAFGARERWEEMGRNAHQAAMKRLEANPPRQLLDFLGQIADK